MKILNVIKTYEPFKMNNGGTIFSVWASVQDDSNRQFEAMVRSFTDKIKLDTGQEYKEGDNCDKIKEEIKNNEKTGNKYNQYTIYAKKTEKSWGGKVQHNYTKSEYDSIFAFAFEKVKDLCDKNQVPFQPSLVSTYMIGAKDLGIKTDGPPVSEIPI